MSTPTASQIWAIRSLRAASARSAPATPRSASAALRAAYCAAPPKAFAAIRFSETQRAVTRLARAAAAAKPTSPEALVSICSASVSAAACAVLTKLGGFVSCAPDKVETPAMKFARQNCKAVKSRKSSLQPPTSGRTLRAQRFETKLASLRRRASGRSASQRSRLPLSSICAGSIHQLWLRFETRASASHPSQERRHLHPLTLPSYSAGSRSRLAQRQTWTSGQRRTEAPPARKIRPQTGPFA